LGWRHSSATPRINAFARFAAQILAHVTSDGAASARRQRALCSMTVLVDTVGIRFLANRAPYADQLEELLSCDEARGHDVVYGELLIGDVSGRRRLL